MKAGYVPEPGENHDSFRMYMREIAKFPLITREEEIELAEQVRHRNDKDAAKKLVLANLRLVVKIAIEYSNFRANLADLIQEGNMGLLRAVWRYDPQKGTKFGSYALFWIRAYMLKYLMDSWSIVKLGTRDSQRKLFYNLKKEKEKLERDGIIPSSQLLAAHFNVSAAEVEGMEMRLCSGDISLEAPPYEGAEKLMDTLDNGDSIEDVVAENELKVVLQQKLSEFRVLLTEKERFILDSRILAEDPLTLREVSERFKTSKERIRKTELRISSRLTKSLRSSGMGPQIQMYQ